MPTRPGLPADEQPRRSPAAELVHASQPADERAVPKSRAPAPSSRTQRLSLDLDYELVEELRNAVVYLQRQGHPEITQVGMIASALDSLLRSLRQEHGYERFPARGATRPKPGRRPT